MLSVLNKAVGVLSSKQTDKQTLLQVSSAVRQVAQTSSLQQNERSAIETFADQVRSRTAANDNDLSLAEDSINDTSGITALLRQLIQRFEGTIAQAEAQEKSALDQYDGLRALKKKELLQLQSSKDAKDALLAESTRKIAQYQRSLQDSEVLVANSREYLKTLQKICSDESSGWSQRGAIRQEIGSNLQAVQEALNGAKSSGELSAQPQAQMPTSFTQTKMALNMALPSGPSGSPVMIAPPGPLASLGMLPPSTARDW